MQNSIGKPLTRVDGRQKVTGQARYSGEQPIANVAYAVLIMSSIPQGRIASMDTRAAERAPGFLAVLTPFNTPKLPTKPSSGESARPTDRKLSLLQDPIVHYANQPIAVVVADTLERAKEAAHLLKVRYTSEPFNVNFDRSLRTLFTPKKAGSQDEADARRGNVAAALAAPGTHQSHLYTTPFEVHNPMEPHATLAVWESAEKLVLYDATQGVSGDRERVASLLGIPPDNVRVISQFLGGGFGSKGPTWSHVVLAAMAAKRVQRPVKLVLDRQQMFGPIGMRSQTQQTVKTAAQPDGTLTALEHDTVAQTSTFDDFMEPASLSARMLYPTPNDVSTHRLARANIGTPSFMRAPGEAPGTYALECAMDELAYSLNMDPLALRLKNYAEQDPEKNRPWSSKSLRECYRLGAERFGWSQRTPAPRSMKSGQLLVGMGMATAVYPTKRSAASARARLLPNGTALVEAATQDLGTGTYTIMTQVAADAIGLAPEQVTFRLGDTELPETPVSGGSQTAASTGSAVALASRALREKLVQLAVTDSASPLYQATAGDVQIENGRMSLRGAANRAEDVRTLLSRHGPGGLEATADAKPGDERERFSMYAFGAQFAEVHVDPDLGMVRVTRMTGVFAAGRILNARTARNQFIGGIVWGISMALHEHAMMDERRGRFVNNNLAEYHIPVNADIPDIEALWVEETDPYVNPLGVKGIGEIGITGSAAAVANAVFHATGKRVRDLPITLDKLLSV